MLLLKLLTRLQMWLQAAPCDYHESEKFDEIERLKVTWKIRITVKSLWKLKAYKVQGFMFDSNKGNKHYIKYVEVPNNPRGLKGRAALRSEDLKTCRVRPQDRHNSNPRRVWIWNGVAFHPTDISFRGLNMSGSKSAKRSKSGRKRGCLCYNLYLIIFLMVSDQGLLKAFETRFLWKRLQKGGADLSSLEKVVFGFSTLIYTIEVGAWGLA